MAEKKLPKLFKRKWLNKGKGSAYMLIEGELEEHWSPKKFPDDRTLHAHVELKDCNRQIGLEFYANTAKEYKDRLEKMSLLIAGLQELQQFMIDNPVVETKARKKKDYEDDHGITRFNASDYTMETTEVPGLGIVHTPVLKTLELTDEMKVSETPAKEEGIVDLGKVSLTVPREFVPSESK